MERLGVLWDETGLEVFLFSETGIVSFGPFFFLVGVFVLLSLMEAKDWTFAQKGSGTGYWNEPHSFMALLTCSHGL